MQIQIETHILENLYSFTTDSNFALSTAVLFVAFCVKKVYHNCVYKKQSQNKEKHLWKIRVINHGYCDYAGICQDQSRT